MEYNLSPYRSEKQRGYLHIHEPELAKKWDKEYGGKIVPSKEKTKKKKKK
jgi:hypothetical protein